MAKKKPKKVVKGNLKDGHRSKHLNKFKEDNNLMAHKEMQYLEKHGLVEQVNGKIERLERFAAANERIMNVMHAGGWDVTNVFHNYIDLQDKLFELEATLQARGENPLQSPEWMKAREQLNKELQFIHKHKLDFEKFQYAKNHKAVKKDEDDLFTVE